MARKNTYKAEPNLNRSQTWRIIEVATGRIAQDHILNASVAKYEAMRLNTIARIAAEKAANAVDLNAEIVAMLIPALRAWVDLYCTNPETWPNEDAPMLTVATAALKLRGEG